MKKRNSRSTQAGTDNLDFDIEEAEKADKPSRKTRRRKKKTSGLRPESLVGKCLVHIGSSSRDIYDHAVIYITESSPDTVRGIMINKLLFGTAAVECKSAETGDTVSRSVYEDLYQGGPENPAHGYVLFPSEERYFEDPFAEVQGEIAVSTSFGILQEILDGIGPRKKIIAMGHCLWHRGELEWEIFNNQWLIVPGKPELIFDTKFEDRWEKAMLASGLNLDTYLPQIGLA